MKKIVALCLTLFSAQAFASGYTKPVLVGPKAIGMGGAFVGVADDTTAIFHNPAGMSQLKHDHNFQLGADTSIVKLRYEPPVGPVEMSDRQFFPVPSFGYVNRQLKMISFGLGVYFPQGTGAKFSMASSVPGNPMEGQIYSMEISPAVAFEIVEGLSIGASLRASRTQLKLQGQLIPLAPTVFDTLDKMNLAGWGYGAAAGLLAKPTDWLRIGANYRSKINTTLKGDGEFATLGAFDAEMKIVIPTLITGGFAAQATNKLLLSFQYDFERNSEVDTFTVTSADIGGSPASLPIPQNWKDSHTYHFGGKYDLTKQVGLMAGYARDFNASIPDASLNRNIGDIDCHEASAGLLFDFGRYNAGLAWNGRWGKRDVPVSAGGLAPGTTQAFLHTISANFGFSL